MICASFCACWPTKPPILRRRFSTGAPCKAPPESGERAGDDGDQRKKGSKVHIAVDTLGHLLALKVTLANEQERA